MKVLFFIPTYNDRHGLTPLVSSLINRFQNAHVLVVDDGSSPAITLDLSNQSEIDRTLMVRLATNEGIGLATSVAIDLMLADSSVPTFSH